jgi:phosphate transport system protein
VPKTFERDLDGVARDVRQMAALVEEAVLGGVRALRDRDRAAAEAVVAGDDEIDRLENAVGDRCHRLLALHQPVAGDLRRVIALMQVTVDLERMGDLAVNIAERALRLLDLPPVPVPDRLAGMADRVVAMVHAGLDAFLHEDAALARKVRRQDDEVDADNAAVIAGLIERMRAEPDAVEPGLSLFSAVRHLERIADHATNIAEDAVYLVEGEVLRHRHDEPVAAG